MFTAVKYVPALAYSSLRDVGVRFYYKHYYYYHHYYYYYLIILTISPVSYFSTDCVAQRREEPRTQQIAQHEPDTTFSNGPRCRLGNVL